MVMIPKGRHEAGALRRYLPRSVWRPLRSWGTALAGPVRFSLATGHLRSSLAGKACDREGQPLPWYTFPAIDFLAQRSFGGKRVLEFGGGQSTLWWSARADFVLTVEEDEDWCKFLATQIGNNVSLHHVPVDRGTRTVEPVRELIRQSGVEQFDLVLIDGHLREELVAVGFDYLAPRGAVLMDNAEGYRFQEMCQGRECSRVDFYGFSPNGWRRGCTSFAFVGDCFLLDNEAPIICRP